MLDHIERWQWWMGAIWLLFILIVVGVLLRMPNRLPVPTPAVPATTAAAEFRLGEERTITIKGRVLLPDGEPAKNYDLVTLSISYYDTPTKTISTDADGYYTAEVYVGSHFMAVTNQRYEIGDPRLNWTIGKVVTVVTDPPTPGQYDIQLRKVNAFSALAVTLVYPDGSPAVDCDVKLRLYGADRNSITFYRQSGGSDLCTHFNVTISRKTDEKGDCFFLLEPGEYDVYYDGGHSQPITFLTGNSGQGVALTIPKPTRFRFVLPDGTAATDLEFEGGSIYLDGWDQTILQQKRPDGAYDITLSLDGTLLIVKTKDGKYGIVRYFQGVETAGDMTVTLLPPATGKIRLSSKKTGKPVAGYEFLATIFMQSNDLTEGYSSWLIPFKTDQSGLAENKSLLVGGKYHIYFPSDRFEYHPLFAPTAPGETIDLGELYLDGDFTEFEPKDDH